MIKWSSILSSAIFLSKERKKIYLPIDQNHQHFVLSLINFYHQQYFLCCLTNNNIQNQITKKNPKKHTNAYRFFTPFWMGFNNQINKNLFIVKILSPKCFTHQWSYNPWKVATNKKEWYIFYFTRIEKHIVIIKCSLPQYSYSDPHYQTFATPLPWPLFWLMEEEKAEIMFFYYLFSIIMYS